MKPLTILFAHILGISMFFSPGSKHDNLKDNYTITSPGLYPESVDFDSKNNRFVFGSMSSGGVFTMNARGKVSKFITDKDFISVAGVFTDKVRNRLIVVSGDIGAGDKSKPKGASAGSVSIVGIFNLTTSALIRKINLKPLTPNAGSMPNDIALDKVGNIYVTDSFSPVIYKIDKSYKASIFATNDLFKPAPGAFGLNGIVFDAAGYFLVSKTDNAKLFKVSLVNPNDVTEVSGISVKTPDGLEFTKDHKLVIVENGLGGGIVHVYESGDNWQTATKAGEMAIGKDDFPTSATLASNGSVYILSSKLGKLLGGNKGESDFPLTKLKY
jgi:sugar lactone lactonase YvrE